MVVNPYPGGWFTPTGSTSRDPRGLLPSDTPAAGQPSGGSRPRFYATQGGPVTLPGDWSDDEARQWVEAYDRHINTLTQQWQQTSGLQRRQIEAQIEDAREGRENARRQMELNREIAQLQAETSRYGIDVGRQNALDRLQYEREQLAQNQKQFDARHGLDLQRHGLDVAEAYTRYSQTPDMMFARNDFVNALGRVGQGLAPKPVGSDGSRPQPKSWEQFAALAGYEQLPTVQAGTGAGGGFRAQPMNATTDPMQAQAGAPDPRIKATRAIVDALPPSGTPGADDNDWAALNAITSLYQSGGPGSVERLGRSRQKIAEAGLARAGFDPGLMREEYMRRRPGQGSVRAY